MPKKVDLTGFLKSEMNMGNTMAVVGVLKLSKFSQKRYVFKIGVDMDILQTKESTVTFKRIKCNYITSTNSSRKNSRMVQANLIKRLSKQVVIKRHVLIDEPKGK